VGQEASLLNIT